MIYDPFSVRLDYIMQQQHITNSHLAELTSSATSTIAGYRSGNRLPNLITFSNICSVLNVSSDYMLGLSDTVNSTYENFC